jgi:predicted phage terminase large subunit-like protein
LITTLDNSPEMARVLHHHNRRGAARAINSLSEFTRFMWHIVEPGKELIWNWHIDILCRELSAVTKGKLVSPGNQLVICVPPGTLKSRLVSVMWPAWEWIHKPWTRAIYLSAMDDLAIRDSLYTRQIIESEEYQQCIDIAHDHLGIPRWAIDASQGEKHHFANTQHGFRQALSMGAGITGKRADKLVIDDAQDAKSVVQGGPELVAKRMAELISTYDHVLASRLNEPETDPRVIIMQRLAPDDLAGELIVRGVRCVVLPMEFDPDHPQRFEGDPRTERGELLFPARFSRKYIDAEKAKPGAARHYAAQYQQNPSPMGGGVFRKEWFRYWTDGGDCYMLMLGMARTRRVLKSDCWRIMVSDTALTTKSISDYSVIQVWDVLRNTPKTGRSDTDVSDLYSAAILLDQWRAQVTAPEVEDQFEIMRNKWNPIYAAMEDTTASKAIIDRLARHNIQVKRLKPADYGGDKVNRAYASSLWMENERVFFPNAAPWLMDLENELLGFPRGHDDQTDATAYAILLIEDRDLWDNPKRKALPSNAIGRFLGHDKLLPQYMDDDAFDDFEIPRIFTHDSMR